MLIQLRTALMGLIFWFLFGCGNLVSLVLLPFAILIYTVSGNERMRDWIYRVGKGMDGVNNASWFMGNPKETISSHTGRWFVDTSGRSIPGRFRFVKWLTDKFEKDHTIKAIEEPFRDLPL